jgi:hypothetical protein
MVNLDLDAISSHLAPNAQQIQQQQNSPANNMRSFAYNRASDFAKLIVETAISSSWHASH